MTDRSVVLFPHPGAEHASLRHGEIYPWTRLDQSHGRKFMVAQARLAGRSGPGKWHLNSKEDQVSLWTEFEPPTRIHSFTEETKPGLPRRWHEFVPIGEPPSLAHGSDPWAFGKWFRYAICMQWSRPFLQHLKEADVLFFGSWMKRSESGRPSRVFNFFLDTVFVVDKGYPRGDTERPIPPAILDPAFERCSWEQVRTRDRRTLYRGAMLRNIQSRCPFSWAPCKRFVPGSPPPRFARPMIGHLFGKTSGNGQAIMRIKNCSPKTAWRRVTEHCLDRGLELAAYMRPPELAKSTGGNRTAGKLSKRC